MRHLNKIADLCARHKKMNKRASALLSKAPEIEKIKVVDTNRVTVNVEHDKTLSFSFNAVMPSTAVDDVLASYR